MPEHELGLGFHEPAFIASGDGPPVFHGQTLFVGPVTGRIRVLPECMDGSAIPAHLGHYVRVAAVIAQPGAVGGSEEYTFPHKGMYSAAGNGSPRHYPPQRSAPAAVPFPPGSCPGMQTAGCIPSVLPGLPRIYPRAVAMMGRPALRSSATSPTIICRVTFSRLDSSTPVTGAVSFLKIFGNTLYNSMIVSYLFRINLNSTTYI